MQPNAVAFAKAFFGTGMPVAAVCCGLWTVLEAGAARGRQMASWAVAQDGSEERRSESGGQKGSLRPETAHPTAIPMILQLSNVK